MRSAILASLGVALGLGGHAAPGGSKKTPDGLPPATEWAASPTAGSSPGPAPSPEMARLDRALGTPGSDDQADPSNPHAGVDMSGGGDPSNPHAGVDMSGDPTNPHAGIDMSGDPTNPHAGVDMSGGGEPSNPHAGLDTSGNPHGGGGPDVTQPGTPVPGPGRAIDPNHRVAGVIHVDAKAKDRVKPGSPLFLTVKRAGSDGTPTGPPLAVDKLSWTGDGMAFELTGGNDLSGDVIVMARYDQDSDASTKQPGDVTGQLRVKVPADHVKITLDTILP
jgi:hypothetical protein